MTGKAEVVEAQMLVVAVDVVAVVVAVVDSVCW